MVKLGHGVATLFDHVIAIDLMGLLKMRPKAVSPFSKQRANYQQSSARGKHEADKYPQKAPQARPLCE